MRIDECRKAGIFWSDKVYWQVADSRSHPETAEFSSRATQLGKEDFFAFVVIVPKERWRGVTWGCADGECDSH